MLVDIRILAEPRRAAPIPTIINTLLHTGTSSFGVGVEIDFKVNEKKKKTGESNVMLCYETTQK